MNAIRHYIFMFVGLVVLYFFTGLVATFWVGGLVFFCFSIHRMASFVSTLRLINVCYYSSGALAIGSSIFLFIHFGWIATVGFVVLVLGTAILRETQHEKWERRVAKLRISLQEVLIMRTTGKITQEQLDTRFSLILQRYLFGEIYSLKFLYELLLAKEGLSDNEYEWYLTAFEKYLTTADVYLPISALRAEVRARLGLAPYGFDDYLRERVTLKKREDLNC